ncbi:MAG: hypothetical protein ACK4IX_11020 [Candidatus Sericytochromatia bacterium]
MNQTINKIKEKISSFKDLKIIEENDKSITLKPEHDKSFPITLIIEGNKYLVHFKGWNSTLDTEEEALDLLAFGLSDDCRLQVVFAGKIECKWILEVKENNKWVKSGEEKIALIPFWQKKKVEYFQNKIIKV